MLARERKADWLRRITDEPPADTLHILRYFEVLPTAYGHTPSNDSRASNLSLKIKNDSKYSGFPFNRF